MPKRLTRHGVSVRKTRIGPDLIQAYRRTAYGVDSDTPFTVHVGQCNGPLQHLMGLQQCHSAAYITACNPASLPLGKANNARRQADLAAYLKRSGYVFLQGQGRGVDIRWEAEPSFLVLGMAPQVAKAVGRRWGQNAILWCGEDAVPQLVLLR